MTPPYQQYSCPMCGTKEDVLIAKPVVAGCRHCGTIFKLDAEGNAGAQEPKLPKRPHASRPDWLEPGVRIKYNNREYTLFEILVYSTVWNEYDSEDSSWEKGYTENLEFYFAAPDGEELCITEDDGKLFIRQQSKLPGGKNFKATDNSSLYGVVEYGTFQLGGFVGQDDEPLDRGVWEYKVLQGGRGDQQYEWKKGELDNTMSLWMYKPVKPIDLERWRVRDESSILAHQENADAYAFLRNLFGYSTLAMMLLILVSVAQSKPLSRESWNYTIPSRGDFFATDSTGASSEAYQHSMGVFQLEKNRAYAINAECWIPDNNSDAEFSIQIVKVSTGKPVNSIAAQFSIETGFDDEGRWEYSNLSDKFQFRAEETAAYEIFATVLPKDMVRVRTGKLTVQVEPITLSRFFVFGLFSFALVWLIYQWKWEYAAIRGGDTRVGGWLRTMFQR